MNESQNSRDAPGQTSQLDGNVECAKCAVYFALLADDAATVPCGILEVIAGVELDPFAAQFHYQKRGENHFYEYYGEIFKVLDFLYYY